MSDVDLAGVGMWPFLIGLAVAVVKTFATSAASAAGTKLGEAMFTRLSPEGRQVVVAGSQPTAPREQQVSASQQLLTALSSDEAFRNEVRAILAAHAPNALAAGEEVQKHLEHTPALAEEVVNGMRPVTDFTDPMYFWKLIMPEPPVSAAQAAFLSSPTFHRVCPIGGEDLGWDGVRYENAAFSPPAEIELPTGLLPGAPEWFVAVCTHGHHWQVFAGPRG